MTKASTKKYIYIYGKMEKHKTLYEMIYDSVSWSFVTRTLEFQIGVKRKPPNDYTKLSILYTVFIGYIYTCITQQVGHEGNKTNYLHQPVVHKISHSLSSSLHSNILYRPAWKLSFYTILHSVFKTFLAYLIIC